ETLVPEHRIHAALVEVEGPGPLVVGGAGHADREDLLEPEQPTGDQGAVRPGAGARRDQPVAARLDGPAVPAVAGDAVVDVVHVAVEGLSLHHVRAMGGVLLGGHHAGPFGSAALAERGAAHSS